MTRPRYRVRPGHGPLRGEHRSARDKSISHRAILLGALAPGETLIETPLLDADDVRRTIDVVRRLGAEVAERGEAALVVRGGGPLPAGPIALDAGASGTTARLTLGVVAGLGAECRLDGQEGLRRRPMRRVTARLAAMGARFVGDAAFLPIALRAGPVLRGTRHDLDVASAQVASACLLAGLFAEGTTTVTVPGDCRDHTERMLPRFGIAVRREGRTTAVVGPVVPAPARLTVPVDLSSALYAVVLALRTPSSDLVLPDVGVNPTRTGALEVLTRMGADVRVEDVRDDSGEPVATLRVRASELVGTDVEPELFPRLLDDVPALAAAAAGAVEGRTTFHGVAELRVKESDRVEGVARMLTGFGARVEASADTLVVHPAPRLRAARVLAREDHRIAMAAAVLGATAAGETVVEGVDVVAQSYPGFAAAMRGLGIDLVEEGDAGAD